MKFLVAVPRVSLSSEVEAEGAKDAIAVFRDSGIFAEEMGHLMKDGDFEGLIGAGTIAYVVSLAPSVDPKKVWAFEMRPAWVEVVLGR